MPPPPIAEITETATPVHGVDLGIADDETFSRPNSWSLNERDDTRLARSRRQLPTERILVDGYSGPASRPGISIAWRNAAQVEEVEVRIRNRGDQPGTGRVFVQVLEADGSVLLTLEPPDEFKTVRVPAFANGGREGKIIRMKSSRELNNIIDQYDRANKRYDVRATVETIGAEDVNKFDNSKTKSWNVEHRVEPGHTSVFNYVFKNIEDKPVKVRWLFEHTRYPTKWTIVGIPVDPSPFILQPGKEVRGTLSLTGPKAIAEGSFLESRLSLVGEAGEAWQQKEWFLAYDTIPPTVADYRLVATTDHKIAIQVLVADQGSGVKEATGVSTQYSTDGGLTWSTKAHNYKAGNFVVPTLFEAVIGPFSPETKLQLRFSAKDTVGNMTTVIPTDAHALRAPAGAEKLLELGHVFPRTQPNAIFYLEPGNADLGQVAKQFAESLKSNTQTEPLKPEDIERVARGMPLTAEGKKLLIETAKSLADSPTKAVGVARLQELLEVMPETPASETPVVPLQLNRVQAPGAEKLGNMTTLEISVP